MPNKKNIRVLFVDDEPNILKGLQRSLRSYRKEWNMVFVEGSDQALQTLRQDAFDMMLSDMRMPGMDGSKLMEVAKKEYPGMARIILSGHCDDERIISSLTSVHQFLSKPCEKERLTSAIRRTAWAKALLNESDFTDRLGRLSTLPVLPESLVRIEADLQSDDVSSEQIATTIAQDIGMSAKFLQLVNSSFFGISNDITTLQETVRFLGVDVVKKIVLSHGVFQPFQAAQAVVSVDEINAHGIQTAAIAKAISQSEKMDQHAQDTVVISAMLHDVGRLIMSEYFPEQYKEVIQIVTLDNLPVFQAEQQVFNTTHTEFGAYFLGLWGFSEQILNAVAFHHDPSGQRFFETDICGIVHAADHIEHSGGTGQCGVEPLDGMDYEYFNKTGKGEQVMAWQALNTQGAKNICV